MGTGIITSKERLGIFEGILPRGAIVDADGDRRPLDILKEFSRKAVSIAVVDDAALPDIEASELELLDWTALPQEHPVKLIFAASPKRTAKDAFLKELKDAYVNIVYPQDGAIPIDAIKELLGASETHPSPQIETDIEQDSTLEEETMPNWDACPPTEATASAKARRCKTVACASLAGHPGATSLSMSMALWLARKGRKKVVCVLSDTALFNHLKAGFKEDADGDSFAYKGVTFCSFLGADAQASDASWAVFDCGRIYTTCADTPASAAHRRFYTSGIKLMCLEGQPWDLPKLKDALRDMAPGEVASWAWCARGASDDLITQLRGYLTTLGAETPRWYKIPENPDFFGRRGHDGLDKANYEGILGIRRDKNAEQEGECL